MHTMIVKAATTHAMRLEPREPVFTETHLASPLLPPIRCIKDIPLRTASSSTFFPSEDVTGGPR